jgi:hypothetical protein
MGETPGILIPYFTEELMAVEIISIKESTRKSAENAAEKRRSAVKDAVDQIEFRNAVLFAASTDTKWGEYDADGLDFEQWKERRSQDDESGGG